MSQQDVSFYVTHLSYFGIFLWFLIIEQLTPVPEEVSLMSVGYISMHANLNPFVCGIVSLAGLLITDNFLFYLSKQGNKFSKKLLSKLNHKLIERIKNKLRKKAGATIFVGALVPKLRFFNPIIAGTVEVTWKQFLIFNAAATLLYVTVYMFIGIFFHNQLTMILKKLSYMQHTIFILVMIGIAVFVAVKAKKIIYEVKNKIKQASN